MTKKTKIIIFSTLAIMALAVILPAVIIRRKRVKVKGYKYSEQGSSIITIPNTPFKKQDVIVVYGGLHYATPSWMYAQVLKYTPKLLDSNIFIFVKYSTTKSSLDALINDTTKGQVINAYSIIGFSKGGEQLISQKASRDWRLFGLIDPSTGWDYNKQAYGSESILTYGSKPMMDIYEVRGGRYSALSRLIKKGGGKANKSVTTHSNAPKEFFEKYKTQIDNGA